MARLLVVDDDVGLVSFLCELLQRHGHQARGVSDGFSGVQAVEEENFDVALIDAEMPGMSGVETVARLKALSPRLQVILMSTYDSDHTQGAYTYVTKKEMAPSTLLGLVDALSSREGGGEITTSV